MYFGLLNPNLLWKKRFGSRVSEITSKNCRKAVFLWKNLRRKRNIISITLKTLYFMYFGLLNPNLLWKKRFDSRVSEITSKKLSKNRVSVEKFEKKKEHCFHHIKNTLFYVFWLAKYKFLMEEEVWQTIFGDNLKKLS